MIGGTIPAGDEQALRDLGVAAVYPIGASLADVVDGVLSAAGAQVAR